MLVVYVEATSWSRSRRTVKMVSVEVQTDDLATESLNLLEKTDNKGVIVDDIEKTDVALEDEDEEER